MGATQILGGLFIVITIFGLIGNGVTIFVFFKSRVLRVPQNIFIINLSLCDSLFILSFVPFIVKALTAEWHPSPVGCVTMATLLFFSSATSMICMGFLAFSRFIIIVKKSMKKWFQWKYTILLAIFCWVISLIFFIAVLTKHARIVFYPNMHGCMVDYSYNLAFTLSLMFGIFLPASSLIVFFYWRIYKEFREAKNKVGSHLNHDAHQSSTQRRRREEFLFTLQLFIIFILFEVSLAPPVLTVVFIDQTGTKISGNLYVILEMLATINSVANPYLYLIFHRTFRAKLISMIRKPKATAQVHTIDSQRTQNSGSTQLNSN